MASCHCFRYSDVYVRNWNNRGMNNKEIQTQGSNAILSSQGINFIIEGGKKLSGSVETSRSKNGAVGLLAASLLNKGKTTLKNVPRIQEVHRLIEVLRSIAVSVERNGSTLTK